MPVFEVFSVDRGVTYAIQADSFYINESFPVAEFFSADPSDPESLVRTAAFVLSSGDSIIVVGPEKEPE